MALVFPSSPTNGQTYNQYIYSTAIGAWQSQNDVTNVTSLISGKTNLPGSIVQVVQGVLADPVTFTTMSAWTNIGLSATISPRFSTSKILITVHLGIGGNGGTNYDASIGLFRDSTQIALPNSYASRLPSIVPFGQRTDAINEMSTVGNSYLDSPATTSSISYILKAYSTNSNTHYINRTGSDADSVGDNRMISTITLMEVAQ